MKIPAFQLNYHSTTFEVASNKGEFHLTYELKTTVLIRLLHH